MQPAQYTYPSYEIPLVEAYASQFEAVFILLHPFLRVPPQLAWSATRAYPSDVDLAAHAVPCPWTEVSTLTGLASCARINLALLTSIGSLAPHLADPHAQQLLQTCLQTHPIWMPTEGRFEPLLQPHFLHAFAAAGHTQLLHVPEFPLSDPVVPLPLHQLASGHTPFPTRGTLLAPDASFLFTVDWDSFFTLFYGPRAFLTQIAQSRQLEGFFALPTTEHAWFNYSMGCATVTLSPEHWQTQP